MPDRPSATPDHRASGAVFDDATPRGFLAAAVLWGLASAALGAWLGAQLAHAPAQAHASLGAWVSFGRLKPLHSSLGLLGFIANVVFAGAYFGAQRGLGTRIPSRLARVHLWLWQAALAAACVTLPLGLSQGFALAEAEWPIDLALALGWLLFGAALGVTIAQRTVRRVPIALWFYLASAVVLPVRHVLANLALPTRAFRSVPVLGGVADALAQGAHRDGSLAFLLLVPLAGVAYDFVPRAAGRPVYSRALAIVHFWTLLLCASLLGPERLLDTTAPAWAPLLAAVAALALWAPVLAGVINGLATLSEAWPRARNEPTVRFFGAALALLGLYALETALFALREVDGVAHGSAWLSAHVHLGAMAWGGLLAGGVFYTLVPRLWSRGTGDRSAAGLAFYLFAVGGGLFVLAAWARGASEGTMWLATDPASGELTYPNFLETIVAVRPLARMGALGGVLYALGFGCMALDLVRAWASRPAPPSAVPRRSLAAATGGGLRVMLGAPVWIAVSAGLLLVGTALTDEAAATMLGVLAVGIAVMGAALVPLGRGEGDPGWHARLEAHPGAFVALIAVLGLAPALAQSAAIFRLARRSDATHAPGWTALELAGREIYIREGCASCHTQMLRPFDAEAMRYGEASRVEDSALDHPTLWGSRRIGPDLAREGGRYPSAWHFLHLIDPRSVAPDSIMPAYPALVRTPIDGAALAEGLRELRAVGVGYTDDQITHAAHDAHAQAVRIAAEIETRGVRAESDREIIALIAYVQRLGRSRP